jgi:hypothetical protein
MSSSDSAAPGLVSLHKERQRFARRGPALLATLALVGVAGICWAVLTADHSVQVERRGELWFPVHGNYAGNQACRKCHLSIVKQQEASAHATQVRRVAPGAPLGSYQTGQQVKDPVTAAVYQVRYQGGRNELYLQAGALSASAPIVWEFGSGRRARGYILRTGQNEYVDCRLNWYRQTGGWDFASGQDRLNRILIAQPLGRSLPPAEVARCFGCHSSHIYAERATPAGTPAEQLRFNFDRSPGGLTCEGCHGPRAEHVAAFEKPNPPRPAGMTAAEMNRICARCHSKANIDPSHDVLARFQPWGLERSRCYIESAGRLSCSSCHDPHDNARTEAAYYEAKCVTCHSDRGRSEKLAKSLCSVNQVSGCVSCHMPKDNEGMRHVPLTDHRIRIVRKDAANGLPKLAAAAQPVGGSR